MKVAMVEPVRERKVLVTRRGSVERLRERGQRVDAERRKHRGFRTGRERERESGPRARGTKRETERNIERERERERSSLLTLLFSPAWYHRLVCRCVCDGRADQPQLLQRRRDALPEGELAGKRSREEAEEREGERERVCEKRMQRERERERKREERQN